MSGRLGCFEKCNSVLLICCIVYCYGVFLLYRGLDIELRLADSRVTVTRIGGVEIVCQVVRYMRM